MAEMKRGQPHIVQYDEDDWFRGPDEHRALAFDQWVKKATSAGCTEVVLQLIPDPLFPAHGKTLPYIHEKRPCAPKQADLFEVHILASVHVDEFTYNEADEKRKLEIREQARAAARKRGGVQARYKIIVGNRELESGRQ